MSGNDKITDIFGSKKIKKTSILGRKDAIITLGLQVEFTDSDEIIQIEYAPADRKYCDLTKAGADLLKEALIRAQEELTENYK